MMSSEPEIFLDKLKSPDHLDDDLFDSSKHRMKENRFKNKKNTVSYRSTT